MGSKAETSPLANAAPPHPHPCPPLPRGTDNCASWFLDFKAPVWTYYIYWAHTFTAWVFVDARYQLLSLKMKRYWLVRCCLGDYSMFFSFSTLSCKIRALVLCPSSMSTSCDVQWKGYISMYYNLLWWPHFSSPCCVNMLRSAVGFMCGCRQQ